MSKLDMLKDTHFLSLIQRDYRATSCKVDIYSLMVHERNSGCNECKSFVYLFPVGLRRVLIVSVQCVKRAYKRDGKRRFTKACSDKTRDNSF